jgi:hypothetical protein
MLVDLPMRMPSGHARKFLVGQLTIVIQPAERRLFWPCAQPCGRASTGVAQCVDGCLLWPCAQPCGRASTGLAQSADRRLFWLLRAAVRQGKHRKVPITMAGAREESETALNVCIQHVLDRTGLKPHQARRRPSCDCGV